jgi:hypothetical protein
MPNLAMNVGFAGAKRKRLGHRQNDAIEPIEPIETLEADP